MLTRENINPCNNQIYSSSGIVGTTLTYHSDYNLNNSGAIGTTDIWYRTTEGTITCNLQNEGSLSNYNLALYKIDNEENSTLLFDSQYSDNIGSTSLSFNTAIIGAPTLSSANFFIIFGIFRRFSKNGKRYI